MQDLAALVFMVAVGLSLLYGGNPSFILLFLGSFGASISLFQKCEAWEYSNKKLPAGIAGEESQR